MLQASLHLACRRHRQVRTWRRYRRFRTMATLQLSPYYGDATDESVHVCFVEASVILYEITTTRCNNTLCSRTRSTVSEHICSIRRTVITYQQLVPAWREHRAHSCFMALLQEYRLHLLTGRAARAGATVYPFQIVNGYCHWDQCCRFSRNTANVTPKIICFYY